MLERFAGKVALMTGATQGIGLATARRVGQEGGKVIISSRKEENVQEAVNQLRNEGIEASGITCNQGKKDDRRKLIQYAMEKYGGFDCVFVNAAVSPHIGNLLKVSPEDFQKTFDVNVKEVFLFIRECLPILEQQGAGSIVTNSTGGATDFGMSVLGKEILVYMVSKLTLAAMCYHISLDCFNKNIRINSVLPGMIDTPFFHGGVDPNTRLSHLSLRRIKDTEPAGRMGTAKEVGALVAFLLSDDASYITGESILCAGPQGPAKYI